MKEKNVGVIDIEPFQQNDASILHLETWQNLNSSLKAGFTTRNGGVSSIPFTSLNLGLHVSDNNTDVVNNRRYIGRKTGFPLEAWVHGQQIHQTDIAAIDDGDKGKGAEEYQHAIKGIDGMITNRKGILCTVCYADCVPLYFFDPVSNFIGIAHAGWKGTVNGIAGKMVKKLESLGVQAANLLTAIGPSISQPFYEVDENVMRHIPEELQRKSAIRMENNRFLLDLKQLNVEILLQYGVLRNNIEITNYCTYRDDYLFFSHRREHGKTGRMMGYIGFAP